MNDGAPDPALEADLAAFFERYVDLEPEEGTTLGIHRGDDRLRDVSEAGLEGRGAFFAGALERFERCDRSALSEERRLDLDAVLALCTWEVHASRDLDDAHRNVEWGFYPFTMVAYARAQGLDVSRRLAAIPTFLRAREDALARPGARGRPALSATVEALARVQLPAAASEIATLDASAAVALAEHARFLETEILPSASVDPAIGEDAYRFRLRLSGIEADPRDLEDDAREHLVRMQEGIVAIASTLEGAGAIRDMTQASAYVRALQAEHLGASVAPVVHYRAIQERIVSFLERERLFVLPALDLGMDVYPPGMRAHGAGTNWPAPLLDRDKRGQFVVHPDPAAHPAAWAAVFAAHEGIPGHHLQSAAFRETWSTSPAPVRFTCVADDVMIPRGFVRAMTNIEGWAVYAEELLRQRGFHTGRDLLFAHVAHAIRALRVLGDVGLHTRRLTPEGVVRLLMDEGGMPEANARGELARYGRVPVQAITYFVGQRQLEHLRDRWMAAHGGAASLADFHAWVFRFGPVPPASLMSLV